MENQCNWKKCNHESKNGINSFDIFITDKTAKSELVPYCEDHLDKIRNGKLEKPYKMHQDFYYLYNYQQKDRTNPEINKRLRSLWNAYGIDGMDNK